MEQVQIHIANSVTITIQLYGKLCTNVIFSYDYHLKSTQNSKSINNCLNDELIDLGDGGEEIALLLIEYGADVRAHICDCSVLKNQMK